MDASIAPTTDSKLTTSASCSSFATQTGSGPTKCSHISSNQQCLLCDRESLLHIFTQNLQLNSNPEAKQDVDLLPCSLAITHSIQKISSSLPFRVLFDTGSDNTFIHEQSLPPGKTPRVIQKRSGQMLAGHLKTAREASLQELVLREFSRSYCVDKQHAFVFAGPCDNFLRKLE
jgi:hypothetical protein